YDGAHQTGTEQPGRRGVDRSQLEPLRIARHARAGRGRRHSVARMRAPDQLGCRARCSARQAGHSSQIRVASMARKPARQSAPLRAVFAAFWSGALVMWARYSSGPPQPVVPVQAQLDDETRPRAVAADTRPNVEPSEAKTSRAPAIGAERVIATT